MTPALPAGHLTTIPVDDLELGGANAPVNEFERLTAPLPLGAARLQTHLVGDLPLDALVVNRATDELVVSFHGALNREATALPRFERLRMILGHDVSCLFFGDPTLHLSPRIQLSWYTGTADVDAHAELASRAQQVAQSVGASRIIFTGSSGGGFAALQVSSLVPGSVAVAFNAQTDIAAYRVNGVSWGVQREYVQTVWPAVWARLDPATVVENGHWVDQIDDRISAVRRYASARGNRVYLVQNEEEFHHEDHFLPFLEAARAAGNEIIASTNREGTLHNPPRAETFNAKLTEVLLRERGVESRASRATSEVEVGEPLADSQ